MEPSSEFFDFDVLEEFDGFINQSKIDEQLTHDEILEEEIIEFVPKKKKRETKTTKRNKEIDIKVALCQEISKHPCLYQITSKEYSNKMAKDAIWQQISCTISSSLNKSISVHECRKYWDALRESTRIYLDKAKLQKICDKSGAPADVLELYQTDGSQRFDIYQERWPLAEAMSFFLPSCARSAYTVSIGDRSSTTALKKPAEFEEEWLSEENEAYTVSATPSSRSRSRTKKNGNSVELLDETLSSVAATLSKLVDSRNSTEEVTQLKFKEFHVELDQRLRQMPFMQGMQFCMDIIKQANEKLKDLEEK